MQRKITIWRYLFSGIVNRVTLSLSLCRVWPAFLWIVRRYSLDPFAFFHLFCRCSFISLACVIFSFVHTGKIVRFHALFPLCQIYCMYRLKFIHINHIINTHLQCTKTSCNICVLLACFFAVEPKRTNRRVSACCSACIYCTLHTLARTHTYTECTLHIHKI